MSGEPSTRESMLGAALIAKQKLAAMRATSEARAEAERRYPENHLVPDPFGETGEAWTDPYGYNEDARQSFIAGAEWQASCPVEVTEDMVERMARTLFAQTAEARSGWTWPINGDWGRQRDMKDARRALARILGLDVTPVTPTENGENTHE